MKRVSRRRVAIMVALWLPLLGIVGMIVRGEVAVRGTEWVFPIHGYDPRDLLRGHYLTYRIDWGVEEDWGSDSCLCLAREEGEPVASFTECNDAECDAVLTEERARALERYFVPEKHARDLEGAVQAGRASIVLSVRGGRVAIKDLRIDRRQ